MDDFIQVSIIPEGTSVSLKCNLNKSEWTDATHVINFIGSPDGLSKLRDLRSGDAYECITIAKS